MVLSASTTSCISKVQWETEAWSAFSLHQGVQLRPGTGQTSARAWARSSQGHQTSVVHVPNSLLASSPAPGTSIWMRATPNFTLSFLSSPVEMNKVSPAPHPKKKKKPLTGCSKFLCISLIWAIWCHFTDARNTDHHLSLGCHQSPEPGLKSQQEPQLKGGTWMKDGWYWTS